MESRGSKSQFLIPPPPRLDKEYRTPKLIGGDYRPMGAAITSNASKDAVLLRMLPPTIYTLLSALARSKAATQDMCAYGFLERCIERFFTLTHHPDVDIMTWGEVALFFGRLSRGGKNVKGYGSINDVLMRCNIAPKLFQMAIPDHGQHRRVRLHGMIALVRMSEDPMLCTPILMSSGVTIQLCLDIATNERESDSMRRQALLLLREIAGFPDGKYHENLHEAGIIEPLQTMGRNFTAEVEERADGTTMKKVQTSAKDASSSMESMSVPTLGQISRDILEHLGHVIDEDEGKLQLDEIRMGPFGVAVEDEWIPLYLRDTKAGIEEANARKKLGVTNMDLYNYDPLYATGLPEFLTDKVKGGREFQKKVEEEKKREAHHKHMLALNGSEMRKKSNNNIEGNMPTTMMEEKTLS